MIFEIKTESRLTFYFSLSGTTLCRYFSSFLSIFKEQFLTSAYTSLSMRPGEYSQANYIVYKNNAGDIYLNFPTMFYQNQWIRAISDREHLEFEIVFINDFLKKCCIFPLFFKTNFNSEYSLFTVLPYCISIDIKRCFPVYVNNYDHSMVVLKPAHDLNNADSEIAQWKYLYQTRYNVLSNSLENLHIDYTDIYTQKKYRYFIMPFVIGRTLKEIIEKNQLTHEIRNNVISELNRVLGLQTIMQKVERNNFWIHGDINTSNVIVSHKLDVTIIDFESTSTCIDIDSITEFLEELGCI